MDYKLFLKTFFLAFIIFAVIVVLGIKYNWVKYLQSTSIEESVEVSSGLPKQTDSGDLVPSKPSVQKADQFELVDEVNSPQNPEQQIRNDCIRASRRAGVTDENILAVVKECVEMSTHEQNKTAIPVEVSDGMVQEPPVEDGLELTRKACQIVADEEQGLTVTERELVVEQCIKANMDQR